MTPEAVQAINKCVLCWLATSDAKGQPSVSPKEIFTHHESCCLLIANIASPRSMRNVRSNSRVCVSVLDVFVQKGFQFYGTAEVVTQSDARFASLSQPLKDIAGPDYPFASLFLIEIESESQIIAPRYKLFPETGETEQIESALRAYGVSRSTQP